MDLINKIIWVTMAVTFVAPAVVQIKLALRWRP